MVSSNTTFVYIECGIFLQCDSDKTEKDTSCKTLIVRFISDIEDVLLKIQLLKHTENQDYFRKE